MAYIDLASALRAQFLNEKNPERKPDAREMQFIESLLHDPTWEDQREARAVLDILIEIATHGNFDTTTDDRLALKYMVKMIAQTGVSVGLLEPSPPNVKRP